MPAAVRILLPSQGSPSCSASLPGMAPFLIPSLSPWSGLAPSPCREAGPGPERTRKGTSGAEALQSPGGAKESSDLEHPPEKAGARHRVGGKCSGCSYSYEDQSRALHLNPA